MTYTPLTKKSVLNKVLFAMSVFLILGVLALVVIYNKIVNLEHGIVDMRSELKDLQIANAEFHEQTLGLFDEAVFRDIIETKLVVEKNPDYFETDQKWPLASQY